MPSEVVGKDAKLYYNTGTHASPVWVLIDRVGNVSVDNFTKTKVERKIRKSGWKKNKAGIKEAALSFDYTFVSGADTVFDALLDSFLNDTEVEFAVMDGAIGTSGQQGLRAYMQVFDFPYSQELENLESFDVGLDLTPFEESGSEVEPDWYEVP